MEIPFFVVRAHNCTQRRRPKPNAGHKFVARVGIRDASHAHTFADSYSLVISLSQSLWVIHYCDNILVLGKTDLHHHGAIAFV